MRDLDLATLVVLALSASAATSYTLVMKDGRHMEIAAAPTYKGGKALVTLAGGGQVSLADSDVDRPATEKANAGTPKGDGNSSFTNADLPPSTPSTTEATPPPAATVDVMPTTEPASERDRKQERINELRETVRRLENNHEELLKSILGDGVMDSGEMQEEQHAREEIAAARAELAEASR